jgi:bacillithiol synthase
MRRDLETGRVKIQKSKVEFTKAELKNIAETEPQKLSPNALMRPVAQDYLLPTLTYFGGGAEIAYFAQNQVIYEILNRPITPIRHRASFTIVEPRNRRTLEKYELEFTDLFDGREKAEAKIAEKYLNKETARIFAEAEEIINLQLNRLDQNLSVSEPPLAESLAKRRRKILWHIGVLRVKYHRAEILKNEIVSRRLETLFTSALPHNALQERTLNVLTFLNLYGENFIDWIYQSIDLNDNGHQIIYL